METICASVHAVSKEDLDNFRDTILPFEAKILRHDADSDTAFVFLPNNEAFHGLRAALPNARVSYLPTLPSAGDGSDGLAALSGVSAPPETTKLLAGQNSLDTAPLRRRTPLPSDDIFFLLTDINIAIPLICLLLLLHAAANVCCLVWSPPVATALLPMAGALLLLHTLSQKGTGGCGGGPGGGKSAERKNFQGGDSHISPM